ncbi:hypothetical protein KKA14_12075 [bacterium]|nr:hypothetical protein [bacterium]
MSFSKEEIKLALDYAEELKIIAKLDPEDSRTIQFHRSKSIPDELAKDIQELLSLCIEYHQRSVFTGEYVAHDDNPPVKREGKPIDDINFYLGYYKTEFIKEVKKAFDIDQVNKRPGDAPKLTPFTRAMMDYKKKVKK